jgi:hypothetical protein
MASHPRSATKVVPQTVPLEYAGKWIAWSPDGLRIVAVASSFNACEAAAVRAGFAVGTAPIQHVPATRDREPSPRR